MNPRGILISYITFPDSLFVLTNASYKMMQLACGSLRNTIILVQLFLFVLLISFVIVEGKSTLKELQNNVSSPSPWLRRFTNPRAIGCWNRPWICNPPGELPPRIRRMCCRNRCVDVTSDVNNCGLCGIRCPFTWKCCRGLCIDTNINRFHCGRCGHRCPFRSFCFYGMCGYAQPLPPRPPFPFPPRPHPPHPFSPRPYPRPHGPHHPPWGTQPPPLN